MSFGVIARIHWQALRLWLKRVPYVKKPAPPETLRHPLNPIAFSSATMSSSTTAPSLSLPESAPAAARAAFGLLRQLRSGTLDLQLPDGTQMHFGSGAEHEPRGAMRLRNWKVCARRAAQRRHRLCRKLHRRGLEHARPGRAAEGLHRQPRGGRIRGLRQLVGLAAVPRQAPAEPQLAPRQPQEHPRPLRPGQRVLQAVAGRDDELLDRLVRGRPGRRPGAGAVGQGAARAGRMPRAAGPARARDRLRLGRAGRVRGAPLRCACHRRHAVHRAAGLRAAAAARRRAWPTRPTCACRTTATSPTAPTTRSPRSRCSKPWAASTGPASSPS